jgi:hypothetical protein
MKNVTVSLDEETARWARVWAAKHDTSVSRMLGKLLEEKMAEERDYSKAKEQFLSREPRELKPRSGKLPSRGEVHER